MLVEPKLLQSETPNLYETKEKRDGAMALAFSTESGKILLKTAKTGKIESLCPADGLPKAKPQQQPIKIHTHNYTLCYNEIKRGQRRPKLQLNEMSDLVWKQFLLHYTLSTT